MTVGRSILDAAGQYRFGRVCKFLRRAGVRGAVHGFEHLKQTPSLPLVTLCVQDAFSLEIHVIYQGVASLWCFGQAFELLLHGSSVGRRRFGQHFRQSGLQSGNKKFGLQIDSVGEKLAQLVHLSGILRF